MKMLIVGIVVGAAIASGTAALAISRGQSSALQIGDSAYFDNGLNRTTCAVVSKQGAPTFSCYVTQVSFRKRLGVTINGQEVTVNQLVAPGTKKPYRVIYRRIQTNKVFTTG
jgi:hypothetical protein